MDVVPPRINVEALDRRIDLHQFLRKLFGVDLVVEFNVPVVERRTIPVVTPTAKRSRIFEGTESRKIVRLRLHRF